MLKVLIADDHPLIRKGLGQILSDSVYVDVVDEANDGFIALEMARKHHYDVIILDISLPGKDGMDVLPELKAIAPDTPVLMLSIQPEEQYAVRAFRLGASGCLNKSSAPEELVEAIRTIAGGGTYLSPKAKDLVMVSIRGDPRAKPHEALSERETQVMLHIARGKTVGEIADLLALSVKTVSTYRGRLLEKLNLENNAQIMEYAFRHKLID
ncbi:MAG: response regulator transcription factor [Treponemataceae bacterium]